MIGLAIALGLPVAAVVVVFSPWHRRLVNGAWG